MLCVRDSTWISHLRCGLTLIWNLLFDCIDFEICIISNLLLSFVFYAVLCALHLLLEGCNVIFLVLGMLQPFELIRCCTKVTQSLLMNLFKIVFIYKHKKTERLFGHFGERDWLEKWSFTWYKNVRKLQIKIGEKLICRFLWCQGFRAFVCWLFSLSKILVQTALYLKIGVLKPYSSLWYCWAVLLNFFRGTLCLW